MNSTQLQTTFGPILGLAAGYFAAWWGVDQATALGVLTAAGGLAYSIYTAVITRKSAMVTAVAGMPEVSTVHLNPNVAGTADLNAATPNNVKTP